MPKPVHSPNAEVPTRRSIQSNLAQALGIRAATDLWQAACDACELEPTVELSGPHDILRICDYLETCGGLAAVVGKSSAVRMNFLLKLQKDRFNRVKDAPLPTAAETQAVREKRNARAVELVRLNALGDDLDQLLAPILEQTKALVDLPVAAVTMLTDDAQHIVSSHGLDQATKDVGGTPRDWSFCQFVVDDEAALLIEDTAKAARVREMASVQEYGVGSYIGVPLRTKNQHILGALCAVGGPRDNFSADEVKEMQELGDKIVAVLEERAKNKK